VIFGFMMGASLAYLNKGFAIDGVRAVIEIAVLNTFDTSCKRNVLDKSKEEQS